MEETVKTTPPNEPKRRWMWPTHRAGHWILWLVGLVVVVLIAGAIILHLVFGAFGSRLRQYGVYGPGMMWSQDDRGGFGYKMMGGRIGFGNNSYNATIKSVSGAQVTVTAANGVVETLQVTPQTLISKAGTSIQLTDLKAGDNVTVWAVGGATGVLTATNIQVQ